MATSEAIVRFGGILFSLMLAACTAHQATEATALNKPVPLSAACAGTPANAVTTLPAPLDRWGQLTCTPYGHVIEAHEGWIWTYPGTYSPVFVPAQMVRQNPERLGNSSYFTEIDFVKISEEELRQPLATFRTVFPHGPDPSSAYRLDVTSNSGNSLRLYFFDFPSSPWGIWCPEGECNRTSVFMLLNTKQRPGGNAATSP